MKTITGILTGVMVVSVAFASGEPEHIDRYWMDGMEPFEAERFIEPGTCAQCHDEIHDMWDGSLHSRAFDDPLFRAASKLFVGRATHPGEKEDAEHCVSCHNPIAYRSATVKGSSDRYEKAAGVMASSISCDLCHTIDEIVKVKNASFNTGPGFGEDDPGVKLGPRKDSEPMFHEAAFSKIHTSSEVCGTCHNVTHLWYMTKLEGTYDEWYNSPYNSPDPARVVTCQDCHMRQAPGVPATGMTERPDFPGRSANMGEERPHVYRHSVVGGNVFMANLLGSEDKAALAEERLKSAATLEIPSVKVKDGRLTGITIRVRNEGAGHMLPTGVTEFRQMWLYVNVLDSRGRVVYRSGSIQPDGSLVPGTHVFQTVFGDPEGKPTVNVSEAAMMLNDHRIPPKGYVDEKICFGDKLKKPLTVTVKLRYRSMDPVLVKLLLKEPHKLPIVDMAEIEKTIK